MRSLLQEYSFLGENTDKTTDTCKIDSRCHIIIGEGEYAKIFKVIKQINQYLGMDINAIIVKQVGGYKGGMSFSLTRKDCDDFGVKYEEGLQLFPLGINYKPYFFTKEKKEHAKERRDLLNDKIYSLRKEIYTELFAPREVVQRNSSLVNYSQAEDLVVSSHKKLMKEYVF